MSQVMTRYISNPDNLKLMMNMLKEKSRNIQFEAFHVFKVLIVYFAVQFNRLVSQLLYLISIFVLIALIGFRCKSKQTKTYT